jgi:hypothetical protein
VVAVPLLGCIDRPGVSRTTSEWPMHTVFGAVPGGEPNGGPKRATLNKSHPLTAGVLLL